MDCIPNNLTMQDMGRHAVTLLHHHQLQVTSVIVVGHSMGTMIATEIAIQALNVVIGIALIDGSRVARGNLEEAIAKSNAGFQQMGFAGCIENTFMPMFQPSSDEKEKKRIIDRAYAQPEAISIEKLSSAIRWCASDFECQYRQLKVPVQVVQSTHIHSRGEGSKRVPATVEMHIGWHLELKSFGVDAEFDFVPDCGHFIMLDKPEVVNANIARLLKRIDSAAAAGCSSCSYTISI